MATVTKEKVAVAKKEAGLPEVKQLDEMPKSRRGRSSEDLSAIEDLLKDLKPHAFLEIEDRETSDYWARKIRRAATNINMEVSTSYNESEKALAFQGFPEGEAPARGRRSAATRKSAKN